MGLRATSTPRSPGFRSCPFSPVHGHSHIREKSGRLCAALSSTPFCSQMSIMSRASLGVQPERLFTNDVLARFRCFGHKLFMKISRQTNVDEVDIWLFQECFQLRIRFCTIPRGHQLQLFLGPVPTPAATLTSEIRDHASTCTFPIVPNPITATFNIVFILLNYKSFRTHFLLTFSFRRLKTFS